MNSENTSYNYWNFSTIRLPKILIVDENKTNFTTNFRDPKKHRNKESDQVNKESVKKKRLRSSIIRKFSVLFTALFIATVNKKIRAARAGLCARVRVWRYNEDFMVLQIEFEGTDRAKEKSQVFSRFFLLGKRTCSAENLPFYVADSCSWSRIVFFFS